HETKDITTGSCGIDGLPLVLVGWVPRLVCFGPLGLWKGMNTGHRLPSPVGTKKPERSCETTGL
ncbi:hypothetical protein N9H94_02790, partial [Akkermansiaceae bacterium]|nr:hypothetical protein [Akkermansiaceae bacterium]